MGKAVGVIICLLFGAVAALAAAYAGLIPQLALLVRSSDGQSTSGSAGNVVREARPTVTQVVALARFEPAGGIVELAGTPGDRVEKLLVAPGAAVKQGEELIIFESRTLRKLELEAAQTQMAEAETRLVAERTSADAQIKTAQTAVDSLELEDLELAAQRTRSKSLELVAETAGSDYERLRKVDPAVSSPQQLDHARLARDQAAAEVAAAQDSLKKLEVGRGLRRREAEAKLEQARAARTAVDAAVPVESLKRAVALAEERLRLAVIRAPSAGTILEVLVDEGDGVGATPLVRLADLTAMIARAEVYETQILAIEPGQLCTITSESLDKPLSGVVERIGRIVGKNRQLSVDPRQTTDNRIVEVRIRLNEPDAAARLINMQVTATIQTGKKVNDER